MIKEQSHAKQVEAIQQSDGDDLRNVRRPETPALDHSAAYDL